MERREFLKLLGIGVATAGVAALTMSPGQAATAFSAPPSISVDDLIRDMAEANGDKGAFAWHRRWHRPRRWRRWRRWRRRRCWRERTRWGWRRVCRVW